MSTQSERFEQIVRALAEEGEALDPTLDDSAKLRWYRSQAVAALELPADGSKRQRCHSGHESPAALWSCPVCTDHKIEFYNKLEAAGKLGAAEVLLGITTEPGLLSTLKIDPSTVEGAHD